MAVKDGEVLTSKETEWDVTNPDPQYHYDLIVKAMKETAAALPGKVIAIGGSATGTASAESEATWCDLYRGGTIVYLSLLNMAKTEVCTNVGDA